MGRMVLPSPRSKGGTGKVGFAMLTRGVAGGLVTVTIRFWWLLVLKYSPYPPRTAVRPSAHGSHAKLTRGDRLPVGFSYSWPVVGAGSVRLISAESRPCRSTGRVAYS